MEENGLRAVTALPGLEFTTALGAIAAAEGAIIFDCRRVGGIGRTLGPETALHLSMLTPLNMHDRYADPLAQLIVMLQAPLTTTSPRSR